MNKKFVITGSLAIFLGILMGFIFFYEQPKIDNEIQEKQLFELEDVSEILELGFVPKNGDSFRLSNVANAKLTLIAPYFYDVSDDVTNGILEDLNNIVISEFVERDVKDMSKYGLEIPEMKLSISYKNGKKTTLDIGDISFDGSKRYIKKDSNLDVGYVDKQLVDKFFITLNDVRDKHMLRLNANKINAISYSGKESDISLVKSGEEWIFEENNEDVIDSSKIETWLGRVLNITADSVYGFVKSSDIDQTEPIGVVSFVLEGNSEHKLTSFISDKEDMYYIVPEYISTNEDESESIRPESFVYRINKNVFDSIFDNRESFIMEEEVIED